ncbi:TPA: hypothetical protein ACH3X1_009404 [Trebouxia sp. C0004]
MVTVSAAAILLQRFFGRRSLVHNDKLVVATACLFLAGKVEDTPRSLHRISEHMYEAFCKDFSRVSAATAKARWEDMVGSSTSPDTSSQMKAPGARYKPKALTADLTLLTLQAYQENFKAAVLAAERSLLFTLGFNFRIDTPHKCLLHELQGVAKSLKAPIEQACASAAAADLQPSHVQQAAYDVCNESLRCDVVMTHTPLEIAIASMYFSLKYHNISHLMPGGMQWYSQWSVTEDRIKGVVHAQLQMYIECASHVFPTATPVQISAPATAAASPLPDAAGTPQAVVPAATQQQWLNAKAALSQQHVKPEQSAMPPSQSSQYAAQPVRAPPRVPSQSNIFMPTAPTVQRGLDHQIRNDRRSADKGQMPAPKFVPPSVGVKRPKPDSPSTVAAPVHTHKLVETDMF